MTTGSSVGIGSSAVTTVGTVTTGTWNATVVGLTYGGTNNNLTANNGGIVWSDASKLNILAGTATANQILLSGATATPAWSTVTHPATTTINQLLYSSSANVLAGLATANSAVLVTTSGGVPGFSGTMTNGQLIIGSTTATPTAATLTAGTGITVTNGAGSITISASGSPGGGPAVSLAYNQTGTPAIIGSVNVTSVTSNGTGDFTINYTSAFASAHYAIAGWGSNNTSNSDAMVSGSGNAGGSPIATGTLRCNTSAANSGTSINEAYVCIVCFTQT